MKHKDYCQEELHQNDKDKFSTENEIEDLGAKINDLGSQIDTFKDEIAALDASRNTAYWFRFSQSLSNWALLRWYLGVERAEFAIAILWKHVWTLR